MEGFCCGASINPALEVDACRDGVGGAKAICGVSALGAGFRANSRSFGCGPSPFVAYSWKDIDKRCMVFSSCANLCAIPMSGISSVSAGSVVTDAKSIGPRSPSCTEEPVSVRASETSVMATPVELARGLPTGVISWDCACRISCWESILLALQYFISELRRRK